jgi:hypothetical protein
MWRTSSTSVKPFVTKFPSFFNFPSGWKCLRALAIKVFSLDTIIEDEGNASLTYP